MSDHPPENPGKKNEVAGDSAAGDKAILDTLKEELAHLHGLPEEKKLQQQARINELTASHKYAIYLLAVQPSERSKKHFNKEDHKKLQEQLDAIFDHKIKHAHEAHHGADHGDPLEKVIKARKRAEEIRYPQGKDTFEVAVLHPIRSFWNGVKTGEGAWYNPGMYIGQTFKHPGTSLLTGIAAGALLTPPVYAGVAAASFSWAGFTAGALAGPWIYKGIQKLLPKKDNKAH